LDKRKKLTSTLQINDLTPFYHVRGKVFAKFIFALLPVLP